MRRLILGLSAASLLAGPVGAQPLLNGLFSDHAVVQRDRPLPVFGTARPGQSVSVAFAGQTATAVAGADGAWRADLPALPAGGPYVLTATAGGDRQTVADVLVGDVWLCSGQSNMELPVSRANNAWSETRGASNDAIRMTTIEKADARAPRADFARPPVWKTTSPDTVGDFSASCYYFARELQKTAKVPLGLVNASWGGSAIEAWMSPAALRQVGGFDEALDTLTLSISDPAAANRRWGGVMRDWWSASHPGEAAIAPWTGAGPWTPAPDGLGVWESWGVPALAAFNGTVWFRAEVELTAAQAVQAATLDLAAIDEVDTTFVNGTAVGSTSGAWLDRSYRLAPGALKAGRNLIVIAAYDSYANGGLSGDRAKRALTLADGTRLPLQVWSYRIEPKASGDPPRAPWNTLSGVSTLHNGMLAPIGPYAFDGLAWYQGESNTGRVGTYEALLGAFIAERRQGQDPTLPALVVQLASYGAFASQPGASNTAALREAQRRAVARDPHAGLVVTTDIGDPYDIHPANKQEVGRRLALALRRISGEAVTTGPAPVSAARVGRGVVVVAFDQIGGQLVTRGSDRVIGFELCDAAGACRWSDGRIDGAAVALTVPPGLTPARVRFAWADSPTFNLFDTDGLPAGPFEIEVR